MRLASAQEAFHYDPALEQWASVFDNVEGLYFTRAEHEALRGNSKDAVNPQLMEFYNRHGQQLEYEVQTFKFYAAAIWMNAEYIKRLVEKATDSGINLFFKESCIARRIQCEGLEQICHIWSWRLH